MNDESKEIAIATVHLSERTKVVVEVDLSTFEKTETLEEDIKFWARDYVIEDLKAIAHDRLPLDLLNTPVSVEFNLKGVRT